MASQIVCTYSILNTGPLLLTDIAARMAAAPLDTSYLSLNGLRLVSDSTLVLTRTITLAMDAATPATATVTLAGGGNTNVASVTVGAVGTGYVRPPVLLVNPAVNQGPAIGSRNAATLRANLGAVSVSLLAGGTAYGVETQVIATGGELVPGGAQATFSITLGGGGNITGITLLTAGGPYNSVPTLTPVDPNPASTGNGASFSLALGMVTVSLIKQGIGYIAVPPVEVVPYFKTLYPDAAGLAAQASSVQNFMTAIIQRATGSPVSSTTVAS